MKRTSLILFAVLIAFVSCDKRDLSSIETRLDNLENGLDNANGRISTIEGTIEQINKDIESLQYLKDGLVINNVIGSDAAGWKITFANGKVATIYPKDASTTVPVITVSEDGYWTVDYLDGSGPQYLKNGSGERISAKSEPGEPGKDGVTPVLGADADGYWIVSYDEGQTFSRLLDDKGNPVKAKVSVGDSIFSAVVTDGQKATFTLKDGSSFSCPVVAEFLCKIKDVQESVEFKQGETKTFEMEMKGISNAIVLCPAGWRAILEDTSLKVTAPGATKGNASLSFDSASSIRVLATSTQGYAVIAGFGVTLFVPAPEYDTYYEDWTKNGFITVDGQKIKKEDYGDGTLLKNGNEITSGGAYFIDEGATVIYTSAWAEKFKSNTIIIGNSKKSRSAITINGDAAMYLSNGKSFILKNMNLTVATSTQPLFMCNETYTTPLIVIDNCRILANSNAIFLSNKKQKFDSMVIVNSEFRINKDNSYLGTVGKVGKMRFDNCIFYSKDANLYTFMPLLSSDECADVSFTNNTLINVYRSGNGMVTGSVPNAKKNEFTPVLSNNLRYYCKATAAGTYALGHWTLVQDESGTWYNWSTSKVTSDYVFVNGGNTNNTVFRALLNPAVNSTMLESNPFSTIDYTTGTFVNTTSYGAKR